MKKHHIAELRGNSHAAVQAQHDESVNRQNQTDIIDQL